MSNHVYRRAGSPHWWIDIKVKGRRRIRRSSGTLERKTAEALAQRIEAAEWGRLIHGDTATLTFAEAVLNYVEDGHSPQYTARLVAHFQDKLVAAMGPGDIRAAGKKLYPNAKPATWNRQVVSPARAVINHAASKQKASYIRVKNFPEMPPARRAPGVDWLPAFMDHAEPKLAALALFMRITGARIGQAIGLEWGAVDLQTGTAIVPPAKGYPERIAFLTREMVALLANLDKGRDPLFGYQHRWSVYGPWRAACEKAGIAYVRPHSAGRRAFATAMSRAGVDPKTAAELGGWKSIRLMLDIYTDSNAGPQLVNQVFGTNESQQAENEPRGNRTKSPYIKGMS